MITTGLANEYDILNLAKEKVRQSGFFFFLQEVESSHSEQEIEKEGKALERQGYRK